MGKSEVEVREILNEDGFPPNWRDEEPQGKQLQVQLMIHGAVLGLALVWCIFDINSYRSCPIHWLGKVRVFAWIFGVAVSMTRMRQYSMKMIHGIVGLLNSLFAVTFAVLYIWNLFGTCPASTYIWVIDGFCVVLTLLVTTCVVASLVLLLFKGKNTDQKSNEKYTELR